MAITDWLLRRSARARLPNPGMSLLGPCRRSALDDVLAAAQSRTRPLAADLARGDADARHALAAIAESALRDMREQVQARATAKSRVHQMLAHMDRWWLDTDEGEHIDDPDLDPQVRQRVMGNLDRINQSLDSYRSFLDLLRPAVADIPHRPLRIIDLAAGHGGFALSLARAAQTQGMALEITATDLKREYLDMGQREARAHGLPVNFAVQDALDLSNLEPGCFDVVVCTQSLHHFAPGQVAVMLAEASRVAGHSVAFTDGARSLMFAVPVYAYIRATMRDPLLAHDAWISFRKFFALEELLLLAQLGPWGAGARVHRTATSHWALHIPTRPAI